MKTQIQLENDIEAWADHELSEGVTIPDFWNENDTSARLASWLENLGYAKNKSHSSNCNHIYVQGTFHFDDHTETGKIVCMKCGEEKHPKQ